MFRQNNHHYRLVGLDLDGTVLLQGKPISACTRAAIAAAQQQGVQVALVSGRMFWSALPFIRELELCAPVVCLGGAVIKDPSTSAVLFQQGVSLELAREVIVAGRGMGLPVNVYIDDQVYVDRAEPDMPAYPALMRMRAQPVGDLLGFLDRDPTYLALVCEQSETKQRVLEARARFGDRVHVTSGHPLLAEICHPRVSKGAALAWLAENFGVERAQILAMGNDWNDVPMLDYAGLGVAMSGSPPEVLAAADVVAPPLAEDSVGAIIEEYVLRS